MSEEIDKIKNIIRYESETGKFFWLENGDCRKSGKIAGNYNGKNPYSRVMVLGKSYLAHRLAWAMHYGYFPVNQVDHINLDRRDNRICNLREADRFEQGVNRSMLSSNTSGWKGVTYCKAQKKWVARIRVKGSRINLGYFEDIKEAAEEYIFAALHHHGEFVRL